MLVMMTRMNGKLHYLNSLAATLVSYTVVMMLIASTKILHHLIQMTLAEFSSLSVAQFPFSLALKVKLPGSFKTCHTPNTPRFFNTHARCNRIP